MKEALDFLNLNEMICDVLDSDTLAYNTYVTYLEPSNIATRVFNNIFDKITDEKFLCITIFFF